MDPITQISGPLDAASFNDEATAYGTKVLAEITQVTSKVNEVIDGLTTVAADLDTAEGAASTLSGRVTTAEADIATLENTSLDHEDRVAALEASAASYGTTLYGEGGATKTMTAGECQAYRVVMATGAGTYGVYLPHDEDLQACQPITFMNESSDWLSIGISGAAARWGNDGSGFLPLSVRQYVTLIPMAHPTVQAEWRWFILAGSVGYGDIS